MKNSWYKLYPVSRTFIPAFFLLSVLWLFISPYFQQAQLKVELEMERNDHVQVFWKTKTVVPGPRGYSQEQSHGKPVRPGRAELVFYLPSLKTLSSLRIDPSARVTDFILHSISLHQAGFTPVFIETRHDIKNFLELRGVDFTNTSGAGIGFTSSAGDPQLELIIDQQFSYWKYVLDKRQEYSTFISKQMDLLGLDWSGFFFLGIDILLLISISATLLILSGLNTKNAAELCVLLGLTSLGVVIFSVILCGVSYLLNWKNLLISHVLIWGGVHIACTRGTGQGLVSTAVINIKQTLGPIIHSLHTTLIPRERKIVYYVNAVLLAAVIFLLVYYIIPAAFTLPLNFDSNDYRLSRVGYWLQEANVWQFQTNDIRQIVMPPNCDLAMLWITSFFKEGYPLVHLMSYFGGFLVCCSIYAICQQLKFPKHFCLIAVLIWLGIPNSASQMLTSQTDLFTTGALMAGLYCFYMAVRHSKYNYYIYAGLGIGLSIGAKSTVFLWGPGLLFLCLAIVAGRVKTLDWKVFIKGTALLILFMVLSGGFVYGQNFIRYGNFLGPSRVVASIHDSREPIVKEDGVRKPMSKTAFVALRGQAYFWQIFEPSSNLNVIRPLTDLAFNYLENDIYETNATLKSSFVSMFKTAASWLRTSRLSEDYVSFGAVVFFLMLSGGIFALGRSLHIRDSQSIAVTILFVSVLLYMLFFCWIVGWTVHRYRYAVLVTPFLAVIGMYFLSVCSVVSKRFGSSLALIASVSVVLYQIVMSVNVANNSRAHGWISFRFPERVYSYVYYWRDARHLTDLLPENIQRLGLVLSKGSWKSMFYRTGRDIKSYTIPVKGTINATHGFLKEKKVDALITKKLSSIAIKDSFNLLPSLVNTYQALIPTGGSEDRRTWLIPNGSWSDGWVKLRGEVRIGNWESDVFSVQLCNPAPVDETISMKSSVYHYENVIKANSECEKIDIPVNDNDLISWRIKPGYHPWKKAGATETRSLGIQIKFPKPE
ncbi:MAG TPA: hypothetical protein EYG88_04195 [Desulfocapsa sulfexigens]|nr:hypothetical protein [Desulfocapsa sulfexigens]